VKKDATAIVLLVDASGSMGHMKPTTLESINKFLAEQKAIPGDAYVSLYFFSDEIRQLYDFVELPEVTMVTDRQYKIEGGTRLYDAVVTSVVATEARVMGMSEAKRPSKVVLAVFTDGQDTGGAQTIVDAKKAVERAQERGWQVLFLGEGLDVANTGAAMAIPASHRMAYTHGVAGTESAYKGMSRSVGSYRSGATSASLIAPPDDETP
jgi:formylmethanofuran dehydrogenase subunit E-like metal-binding protein